MVILFSLLSAVSFGVSDFMGGLGSRKTSALVTIAWSQAAGLAVALVSAPLLGSDSLVFSDLVWGIAAGLCGAAGVGLLFEGLAKGQAAIVSPAAAVAGAVIPVLFGLLTGERPPLLTWVGVILAIPAIFFLVHEESEHRDGNFFSLKTGLLAGVAFSGFFILISRTSEGSGLWPLLAARIVTVPLFFLILARLKKPVAPVKQVFPLILISGCLDMLANVFYLLATRSGFLVIAVILTALYPAPTVLLQRFYLDEKLSYLKITGLVMSLAGIALIGIGQ